jgi:hypothetical protein
VTVAETVAMHPQQHMKVVVAQADILAMVVKAAYTAVLAVVQQPMEQAVAAQAAGAELRKKPVVQVVAVLVY